MEHRENERAGIPELPLEQWRLGELSASRKNQLIAEFSEARIERELEALERSEQSFLRSAPNFLGTIENEASLPPQAKVLPLSKAWPFLAPLLVAAAALFTIYLPQKKTSTDSFFEDDILLKGDVKALAIYKQTDEGVLALADGALVKAGDVVQLVYNAEAYDYGIIISVDGTGHVTWHFPTDTSQATQLINGQPVPLKNSFRLDSSPRYERFFFLRSKSPIQLDLQNIAAGQDFSSVDTLPLPSEIDQFSFLLRK